MLTNEDRGALAEACGWPGEEHADLTAVVEAIVARHVKAALNEAADKVDGWREMAAWAASHTEDPDQAQNSVIRSRAYERSARIVRAAADTT